MAESVKAMSYCFATGKIMSTDQGESVIIPLFMAEKHYCTRAHCRKEYYVLQSCGHWLCSFHPEPFNDKISRYPCCGSLQPEGCVRGDHIDILKKLDPYPLCESVEESDWKPAMRVTKELLSVMNPPPRPEAVRKTKIKDQYLLLRYDPRPHESAISARRQV